MMARGRIASKLNGRVCHIIGESLGTDAGAIPNTDIPTPFPDINSRIHLVIPDSFLDGSVAFHFGDCHLA